MSEISRYRHEKKESKRMKERESEPWSNCDASSAWEREKARASEWRIGSERGREGERGRVRGREETRHCRRLLPVIQTVDKHILELASGRSDCRY